MKEKAIEISEAAKDGGSAIMDYLERMFNATHDLKAIRKESIAQLVQVVLHNHDTAHPVAKDVESNLRSCAEQARTEKYDDWYCLKCQEFIDGGNVTHEELHELCGATVICGADIADFIHRFQPTPAKDVEELVQHLENAFRGINPNGEMGYDCAVGLDVWTSKDGRKAMEQVLTALKGETDG